MVGSARIARFSCGTYSPLGSRVEPVVAGEQPDFGAELARAHRGCVVSRLRGIRCCSIGFSAGSTMRAAVEGADRQRDRQRLDQKPHADGRAARGDREADAGVVQLPHRALARSVRILSLVRSVPSTSETTSAMRVMGRSVLTVGATMLSTIASTGASIETVTGCSSAVRRLQRLELAVEQPGRHEMSLALWRAGSAIRAWLPSRKTMRTSSRPCTSISR